MNIWFVRVPGPQITDEEIFRDRIGKLAQKLIDHGHKILWWTSAFDHYLKTWNFDKDTRTKYNDNLEIYSIKGKGYKKNISFARFSENRFLARRFRELAAKEIAPDIIVTCSPPHDIAEQAVKYAKKNIIPVVLDLRDEWPDVFLQKFPKFLRWFGRIALFKEFRIFKNAVKKADSITSMMNSMLEWGLKTVVREKSDLDKVFYLGSNKICTEEKSFTNLSFLDRLEGQFIAAFAGTFVYSTAPWIFVECARLLKDEKIHFVLAGDGELLNQTKELAKDLDNVTFTGWLNQDEVMNLLKRSNIGLSAVPKTRDAFSNKIFSYFAAGLPIITSYSGELKEIIEKDELGLYFTPGDVDALKNNIQKLCKNKEQYDRMRANVERVFLERFDADIIYEEFAKHIEECVENYKIQRKG